MFLEIIIFIFGASVGSFLNVCIHRLPEHRSLITPSSHCPQCKQAIRIYDNIPLISFFLLRGRCRDCGRKISWRYPLVEFITAAFALLIFKHFGLSLAFLFHFVFVSALIVITFIDLDHQIIPDIITLPGIPFFFLAAVIFLGLSFWDGLLGLVIGGGSLFLLGFVYELITKREGMGGGDVKLLAMMGAFLGWQSLLFILLVSSFLGALIGITVMFVKGKDMKYAVPFGPFLTLGALTYIFFGRHLVDFLLMVHQIY